MSQDVSALRKCFQNDSQLCSKQVASYSLSTDDWMQVVCLLCQGGRIKGGGDWKELWDGERRNNSGIAIRREPHGAERRQGGEAQNSGLPAVLTYSLVYDPTYKCHKGRFHILLACLPWNVQVFMFSFWESTWISSALPNPSSGWTPVLLITEKSEQSLRSTPFYLEPLLTLQSTSSQPRTAVVRREQN